MRLPVNNWSAWYIAQGFGEKTSYGYHDGCDLNLKTGGDTDLGQPLLAIADGEVTSVHNHTTKPTFGLHLHLKVNTPFGERWAHYAHCNKVSVNEGDRVLEGQQIAEVGKTGTDLAHCHFAIKNQPTGVDGIAKTLDDLKKWEDPITFIENCIAVIEESNEVEGLKQTIKNQAEQIKGYQQDIARLNEIIKEQKTLYDNFINRLWDKLKPTNGTKDEATIIGEIEHLIAVEDSISEIKAQAKKDIDEAEAEAETCQKRLDEVSQAHTTLQKKYEGLLRDYSVLHASKIPRLTFWGWLVYWFVKGGENSG
jgi:archaellum component FlaC